MDLTGRLRNALDPFIESGYLPGYVAAVRQGGRLTVVAQGMADVEHGLAMSADTQFRLASLTKPIGAIITLQLVANGLLRLADPIARWLPSFADPPVLRHPNAPLTDTVALARPITVADLLRMSSGVGHQYGTPLGRRQVELGLRDARRRHVPDQPELDWAALAGLPLAFQPGSGWAYEWSSELLTSLVVAASQASPAELVAAGIRAPLGLGMLGYRGQAGALAAYYAAEDGADLRLVDASDGLASSQGLRQSLSHGLIGTAGDYLAVLADLASGRPRLLEPPAALALRSPQLPSSATRLGKDFLGAGSYGYGVAVRPACGASI